MVCGRETTVVRTVFWVGKGWWGCMLRREPCWLRSMAKWRGCAVGVRWWTVAKNEKYDASEQLCHQYFHTKRGNPVLSVSLCCQNVDYKVGGNMFDRQESRLEKQLTNSLKKKSRKPRIRLQILGTRVVTRKAPHAKGRTFRVTCEPPRCLTCYVRWIDARSCKYVKEIAIIRIIISKHKKKTD